MPVRDQVEQWHRSASKRPGGAVALNRTCGIQWSSGTIVPVRDRLGGRR